MTLVRLTGDEDEEYETAGVYLESESGQSVLWGWLWRGRRTPGRLQPILKCMKKTGKKKFIKEI